MSSSTFQALPLELFLDIVGLLPTADKQCLRITCSAFRQLIPFDWGAPLEKIRANKLYYLPKDTLLRDQTQQRTKFMDSAFSSSWQGATLKTKKREFLSCGICLRLRRRSKISMETLRIMGRRICDDCVFSYFRSNQCGNTSISFEDKRFYACGRCKMSKVEAEMHLGHDNEDLKVLCEVCHRRVCRDNTCKAWPEGFVEEHSSHFV